MYYSNTHVMEGRLKPRIKLCLEGTKSLCICSLDSSWSLVSSPAIQKSGIPVVTGKVSKYLNKVICWRISIDESNDAESYVTTPVYSRKPYTVCKNQLFQMKSSFMVINRSDIPSQCSANHNCLSATRSWITISMELGCHPSQLLFVLRASSDTVSAVLNLCR